MRESITVHRYCRLHPRVLGLDHASLWLHVATIQHLQQSNYHLAPPDHAVQLQDLTRHVQSSVIRYHLFLRLVSAANVQCRFWKPANPLP